MSSESEWTDLGFFDCSVLDEDRCDEKEDCYYDLSEEDYDLSDDLIDREFCDCLYELSGDDSCNVSYESDYDIICYICIGGGGIGGKLYRGLGNGG